VLLFRYLQRGTSYSGISYTLPHAYALAVIRHIMHSCIFSHTGKFGFPNSFFINLQPTFCNPVLSPFRMELRCGTL